MRFCKAIFIFVLLFPLMAVSADEPEQARMKIKGLEELEKKGFVVHQGTDGPLLPPSTGYTAEFEQLHLRPDSDNAAIVSELEPLLDSTTYPYLYEYARRAAGIAPDAAVVTFYRAGIRARYDAMRCTDPTAPQGIRFWPSIAKPIQVLAQQPTFKQKLPRYLEQALDMEEQAYPNYAERPPYTVCFHGMKAVSAKMEGKEFVDWHTPPDQWEAQFNELMKKSRTSIEKLKQ